MTSTDTAVNHAVSRDGTGIGYFTSGQGGPCGKGVAGDLPADHGRDAGPYPRRACRGRPARLPAERRRSRTGTWRWWHEPRHSETVLRCARGPEAAANHNNTIFERRGRGDPLTGMLAGRDHGL